MKQLRAQAEIRLSGPELLEGRSSRSLRVGQTRGKLRTTTWVETVSCSHPLPTFAFSGPRAAGGAWKARQPKWVQTRDVLHLHWVQTRHRLAQPRGCNTHNVQGARKGCPQDRVRRETRSAPDMMSATKRLLDRAWRVLDHLLLREVSKEYPPDFIPDSPWLEHHAGC